MPNVGKPSEACHLCRSRRVKCDLARPSCQRCIKYGQACPGYRDRAELRFRIVNPSAASSGASKPKRPPSGASSRDSSVISSWPTSPSSASLSDHGGPAQWRSGDSPASSDSSAPGGLDMVPRLLRPVNEHWTAHSVPILLDAYATLGFLSDLYSVHSDDGPLLWAAHLFSRTYVLNVSHPTAVHTGSMEHSKKELGTYMGKALNAVSSALKSPGGAFRDDVLGAVWVLANYELLIGSVGRQESMSPWHLHARGLYSILKARGAEVRRQAIGRSAFWSAFHLVQIDAVITATPCPPETAKWLALAKEDADEMERFPLITAIFMQECCSIQARMLALLRREGAAAASAAYLDLSNQLDEAVTEATTSFTAAPLADDLLNKYWWSAQRAAAAEAYHIEQLCINYLANSPACKIPPHQLQSRRQRCLDKIHDAASGILDYASMSMSSATPQGQWGPSMLFRAIQLVWPLVAVYTIPSTSQEHKSRAQTWLIFIGKSLGVRQALRTSGNRMSSRLERVTGAPPVPPEPVKTETAEVEARQPDDGISQLPAD